MKIPLRFKIYAVLFSFLFGVAVGIWLGWSGFLRFFPLPEPVPAANIIWKTKTITEFKDRWRTKIKQIPGPEKVVEKVVEKEVPGPIRTEIIYLKPGEHPTTFRRWSFNSFELFGGVGGAYQPQGASLAFGGALEGRYRPVCLNGARFSGCLEVNAGGMALNYGITEARIGIGGVLEWR